RAAKLLEETVKAWRTSGSFNHERLACIRELSYVHGTLGKPAAALDLLEAAAAEVGRTARGDETLRASIDNSTTLALLHYAARSAWQGRTTELDAHCDRAWRFAKDTSDPVVAERAAKIMCIKPSGAKRQVAARELAQRAVDLGRGNRYTPYFMLTLGLAEYRGGRLREADIAFDGALAGGAKIPEIAATSRYMKAMIRQREGNVEAARRLATEAAQVMTSLPEKGSDLDFSIDFNEVITWMICLEAKELVSFEMPVLAAATKND
ncbi:MAG TPA: hypothetical protein VNC50_00250, partial [Planctomycetia bacterium]|nr:hypothetical protein [Planctomycetia bacterium]